MRTRVTTFASMSCFHENLNAFRAFNKEELKIGGNSDCR